MGCCGGDKSNDKFSKFPDACFHGDLERMKKTLGTKNKDSYINETDHDGITPLHRACQGGHVAAIEFLLDARANVEKSDRNGYTPLHLAVSHSQVGAVRVLLSNPKAKSKIDDPCKTINMTPLHIASCKGNLEIVKLLVEAGADLKARDRMGDSCFDHAHFWNENAGRPDAANNTVAAGHKAVFNYLSSLPEYSAWVNSKSQEIVIKKPSRSSSSKSSRSSRSSKSSGAAPAAVVRSGSSSSSSSSSSD